MELQFFPLRAHAKRSLPKAGYKDSVLPSAIVAGCHILIRHKFVITGFID
jgi:hypothetical protein